MHSVFSCVVFVKCYIVNKYSYFRVGLYEECIIQKNHILHTEIKIERDKFI